MNKVKHFLKQLNYSKLLNWFLLLFVIMQGIAIFLVNLLQTDSYLFNDNVYAIRHGIEIWRHGLFLENFNYYSTMEIDNAAFFAIPLYFLTNNLGLSLGIVHLLLYILSAYLIYSIFQNGGYDSKYGLLAIIFLFTPFVISGLDWGNMLFVTVGQYEFRVIVMLSTINLLLITLNTSKTIKQTLPLFLFHLLLCFWTTLSCGNYVILMILLPFCMFFVYINCITERLQINKKTILTLAGTLLICALALVIRNYGVGETGRSTLPLLTADTFSANLLNCITGFFMLFGGLTQEPDVPIFTVNAILRIAKFIFICGCLILTYSKVKKAKPTDYLHYMFVFLALVNLGVMILAFTRYGALIFEYRYHLIWGAMLLLTTAASIDSIKYVRLKNLTIFTIICMVALINLGGFKSAFAEADRTALERQILRIADEEELNTIYMYNMPEEAATIKVLDYNKSCISVTYVVDYVYRSTEDYFENYEDYAIFDERHLFACTPDYFELIPDVIKEVYDPICTIGNVQIYIGHENPWLE